MANGRSLLHADTNNNVSSEELFHVAEWSEWKLRTKLDPVNTY
jgi:hypothetical protein